MSLHYLGKHEYEPRKFGHAVYRVSKTTLIWLAIYIRRASTNFNNFL